MNGHPHLNNHFLQSEGIVNNPGGTHMLDDHVGTLHHPCGDVWRGALLVVVCHLYLLQQTQETVHNIIHDSSV